jgi:plastocyanin
MRNLAIWAAALGPLLASGCGVAPVPGAPQTRGEATAPACPATAPATATETVEIVVDSFTFRPMEVTVKSGTKVVWVNRDDVPHTATSTAKPKAFDSGTLDTDQSFAHVFTAPGTYPYFCAVHPKMTGTVIVK